jgi:hypothetical protein
MKKILLISFILITHSLSAQIQFQRSYGTGTETGNTVLELPDGYLMMGNSGTPAQPEDILIVKTNHEGVIQWSKTYGGIFIDEGYSMVMTYDSCFVIAGFTESFGGLDPNDFEYGYLFKIDAAGNLLWSKVYDTGVYDVFYSVKETFDRGFIMAGTITGFTGGTYDLWLVKTDSLGNSVWSSVFGSPMSGVAVGTNVIQKRDSGFIAVGYSNDLVGAAGDTAALILALNKNGVVINSEYTNVSNVNVDNANYAYDVVQNQNGDLVVTGGVGGFFQNLFYAYSPFTILADSLGHPVQSNTYSFNTGATLGFSIKNTNDSGYIIGGTMGIYYPFLLKTDSSFNKEWCYYYGNFNAPPPINQGSGSSVIQCSDNGFALSGNRKIPPGQFYMNLIKTDASGISGCNQDQPSFQGNSSQVTFTNINGTVFATNWISFMSVTSTESLNSLADSTYCISTGIQENLPENKLLVYPNPSKNILNFRFAGNAQKMEILIIDLTGKVVTKNKMATSPFSYDISELKSGMYILEIRIDDGSTWHEKFVKE